MNYHRDSRFPNNDGSGLDYIQLWCKGELFLLLAKVGAGIFLGCVFIAATIAGAFSAGAEQVTIEIMVGGGIVGFPLVGFIAALAGHTKRSYRKPQTWQVPEPSARIRASFAPWPNPEPWKSQNPLNLAPYRINPYLRIIRDDHPPIIANSSSVLAYQNTPPIQGSCLQVANNLD